MVLEKVTWLQRPHTVWRQKEAAPCLRWEWVGWLEVVLGKAGPPVAHFLPVAEDLLGVRAQDH